MVNGIIIGDFSIDSKAPDSLQAFYAGLLGWEKRTMWNCPALNRADNGENLRNVLNEYALAEGQELNLRK